MKKIIITSTSFAGQVDLIYGVNDELLIIDFQLAGEGMTEKRKQFLKQQIPVIYDNHMSDYFDGAPLEFLLAGYKITFTMFWTVYNKKINKARTLKEWDKLKEYDQAAAYVGYAKYEQHLKENTWKTKADPENYLKKRYWENEY